MLMVYHLITKPSHVDYMAYMDYMDLAVSCPRKAVNTLRPRQDGRRFTDDIFKCIFFNENV